MLTVQHFHDFHKTVITNKAEAPKQQSDNQSNECLTCVGSCRQDKEVESSIISHGLVQFFFRRQDLLCLMVVKYFGFYHFIALAKLA